LYPDKLLQDMPATMISASGTTTFRSARTQWAVGSSKLHISEKSIGNDGKLLRIHACFRGKYSQAAICRIDKSKPKPHRTHPIYQTQLPIKSTNGFCETMQYVVGMAADPPNICILNDNRAAIN
jgi:hypothetical protein